MDRWVGKIAVVTGASSGIGAVIAKELADKGVIVVALARRLERLQTLTQTTKGKIHPKACDLQKESDILQVFRWVEITLGGVDIMINNSGVLHPSTLMNGDTESWKQMYKTNVLGLNICTREALKSMRQRGDSGHIIHINSTVGHRVPNFKDYPIGVYSSTKYAVTALTEALRLELQKANSRIKITSISPGCVYTEMVISEGEGGGEEVIGGISAKDFLRSEDISEAVIYVLSTKPNVQVHEIIIQPLMQTYD